ncbi:hypothetical protein TNCV_3579811 [Trichonephila clavipes]|nr:hypothetical protein TNCV_3579811 [Trichonephila clavipes]
MWLPRFQAILFRQAILTTGGKSSQKSEHVEESKGRIVIFVQEESDPVDDEMYEDEDNNHNESRKGPSNADAFSALEAVMVWYEQQSECSSTQLQLPRESETLQRK